jgi:Uma2 family endonuclease
MVVDAQPQELRLVREVDGLDLDLDLLQGLWTEEQYLKLSGQTNRLIEFTDGVLEVLPVPTETHQMLLALLYELLKNRVRHEGGVVHFAGLRVRIRPGKFREPDVLLLLAAGDPRRQNAFWLGADLVVEIVSPDNPERDTVDKRLDYAEAGIPEYWIVNPLDETIAVLTLRGDAYATHGVFRRGEQATSPLLPGFRVSVDAVFDAG